VIPRRSIKTIKKIARKTPSKLAARVPGPLEGMASERDHLVNDPRMPPSETSQTAFKDYTNFLGLKTVVITLMMREAKSADQKPVTSNFSLQRAVNDNIAALTTKRKSPKVTIETGKVNTLMMDPKTLLMSPKRSATQR
jgi:hypothetical protein